MGDVALLETLGESVLVIVMVLSQIQGSLFTVDPSRQAIRKEDGRAGG